MTSNALTVQEGLPLAKMAPMFEAHRVHFLDAPDGTLSNCLDYWCPSLTDRDLRVVETEVEAIWQRRPSNAEAYAAASKLFEAFPNARPNSRDGYINAVAGVMRDYPLALLPGAIRDLIRSSRFIPTASEVVDVLNEAIKPLSVARRHIGPTIKRREQIRAEAEAERERLEQRAAERAEINALAERFGDWDFWSFSDKSISNQPKVWNRVTTAIYAVRMGHAEAEITQPDDDIPTVRLPSGMNLYDEARRFAKWVADGKISDKALDDIVAKHEIVEAVANYMTDGASQIRSEEGHIASSTVVALAMDLSFKVEDDPKPKAARLRLWESAKAWRARDVKERQALARQWAEQGQEGLRGLRAPVLGASGGDGAITGAAGADSVESETSADMAG